MRPEDAPADLSQNWITPMPLVTAVVLAIIVGVLEVLGYKLPDPWRMIVIVAIVVLLVVGIILLVFPGVFSGLGRY
jgi:membrane protein YdbS with pleckstrin-like domain